MPTKQQMYLDSISVTQVFEFVKTGYWTTEVFVSWFDRHNSTSFTEGFRAGKLDIDAL